MSLLYDLPPYQPTTSQDQGQGYQDAINQVSNLAQESPQSYQNKINQGVSEKSNLLGSTSPDDPEAAALQARAKQMYGSDVNQMTRANVASSVDRQNQIQTQDVANRAAIFSNAQSRASINFQQVSYMREAAIQQEISRRTLYAQLFGGIAFVGGAMAAAGLYNARHPSPTEMGPDYQPQSWDSQPSGGYGPGPAKAGFQYAPGSQVPSYYQGNYAGTVTTQAPSPMDNGFWGKQ